jgi:hypothetical protein
MSRSGTRVPRDGLALHGVTSLPLSAY